LSVLSKESELPIINQALLETHESNMSTPPKTPLAKSVPVVTESNDIEYVSLTELARVHNPSNPGYVIQLWLQNQNTVELMRLCEESNNPDFNLKACADIQTKLRDNAFTLTAKNWIEQTGGIGLQSKSGRYGGTFAAQSQGQIVNLPNKANRIRKS
jgi:KilA-N domain.